MRLDVLREIPEDVELRQQWNALAMQVDRPQVFYTYEWALAVQRAYRATLRPLLFLAYDERHELCGLAALAEDLKQKELSFLCATTGDYCDFLSKPGCREALVSGVLGGLQKEGYSAITLTNLPADSDTCKILAKLARRSGYHSFARTAYICAQVDLAKLERHRGSNQLLLSGKERVRRFAKAMKGASPIRLDHARTRPAYEAILPQFMEAHVARFLFNGRISNLASSERRLFLQELSALLSDSGWLSLTQLIVGNKAVAWNYGFEFCDTWFWYQPTFHNEVEKYSPGYYLLVKLIEEAVENPVLKTVDLGLGAEDYKDQIGNQKRRTLYVTLRTSAVQHGYEITRYSVARIFKLWPRAEAGIRSAASRIARWRGRAVRNGFAKTLALAAKRFKELFWLQEEVFFFEWSCSSPPVSEQLQIEPASFNHLAAAAMHYFEDEETLEYLRRSASRLRKGKGQFFALMGTARVAVHFAWVTDFDGFFLSELNSKVDAPSEDSVMLFDCWTPAPVRGRGYYRQAIAALAQRLQEEGKEPWIFSAGRNASSLRGLEKSGFRQQYSLLRQRVLMWQRIKGSTPRRVRAAVDLAAHSESRAS